MLPAMSFTVFSKDSFRPSGVGPYGDRLQSTATTGQWGFVVPVLPANACMFLRTVVAHREGPPLIKLFVSLGSGGGGASSLRLSARRSLSSPSASSWGQRGGLRNCPYFLSYFYHPEIQTMHNSLLTLGSVDDSAIEYSADASLSLKLGRPLWSVLGQLIVLVNTV